MISIHIERITIVPDGQTLPSLDPADGKHYFPVETVDLWKRTTVYMQTFPDGNEPDINQIVRVANKCQLEDQARVIYQDRVDSKKSWGYGGEI